MASMLNSIPAVATTTAKAVAEFVPRAVYEASPSITRSYFLGHHHAALERMRRILSNVGVVIECRDFRVPLTSWNPLLEQTLSASSDRAHIIVYTKRDLGPARQDGGGAIVNRLADFHRAEGRAAASAVLFLGDGADGEAAGGRRRLLEALRRTARDRDSLTGTRALVVGMPNAGKSTLLNRLRASGMGKAKAARTGAQPGVTRKLGTPVRVMPADDELGEGVFVVDTPGVFVPYVGDPESMLKLALVGCVRDGIVPFVTVADYLLFHLNRRDPALYARYAAQPTNDVHEFLRGVAARTGRLAKGGDPDLEAAAQWIVGEWRQGNLGRFILDEVTPETIAQARRTAAEPPLSMNQARKKEKEARKARQAAKRVAN
ncbi:uncharacterized protein E0L32_011321 [Thyridium curvatum]|uniref:G domain-containing protein n=1 Tax=Thyridium curvatum TaxID=1093900 RepID=A0A507BJJ2_9PEZI|nr:uncharacterized protein E0L32_011321 [Thyridium curvatum]TPX19004.1 hypothetical protein E0L32_011321 [Thyridium curvatum]